MPRQRIDHNHSRITYEFPDDFSQRLVRFKGTPSSRRLRAFAFALVAVLLESAALSGPASQPAAAQAADPSIEYAENGTRAVGVFHAYDQDGDAIEWSLSGPDAGRFTVHGGMLAFRHPPNYEDPQSTAAGNVYRVTIEANGGTHDVAVTVTDVDEAGAVTMDRPQPQVSRPLGASLSDEDEGVSAQRWQWARSEDRSTWTDIPGATSRQRSPEPFDTGMYLRATVTYSDRFGSAKTASAESANRVEARTLSNAAPSFTDPSGDEVTTLARSVAENSAVGAPVGRSVSATDADEDILFYELLDTPDLEDGHGEARFTIDSGSGQIRVGRVLGADPGEREDEATSLSGGPQLPAGEDPGVAGNGEYVLRVRVTDPSTASSTVNVIVTVTNVNEPPEFDEDAPTLLRVRENLSPPVITFGDGDASVVAATFDVTDQDSGDITFRYSVAGDDREFLAFDVDRILRFEESHEPDHEERSSYSITIEARSGEGARRLSAALVVTVEVVDTEDPGEVTLFQREPQEGIEVHAVASDPDGSVRVRRWVWERSAEITADAEGTPSAECRDDLDTSLAVVGGWTLREGAASSVYTPVEGDVGRCLRATATYSDGMGDDERAVGVTEAPVQASRSANAAPHFVDPSGRASRRVAENTEAGRSIGSPVTAFDDDGDLLIYTLGGEDAAFFGVTRSNGQLLTKAPLNYEVRTRYAVEMIATDPSGASASMLVTVNVIDVDDPARIAGSGKIDFAENDATPVGTFRAIDEAGGAVTWTLSRPDAGRFTIGGGVLRFREPPDYEDPRSALAGNVYLVTVEAGGGARDVEVTVTDGDEVGTVRIDRPQPQAERPLGASLSDDDAGVTAERWQWARSEDEAAWTDIDGATSPRRSPAPADVGMYLRATVTYSDGFGPGKTASAVTANRVEARTLSNAAPSLAGQDDDEDTPYIEVSRSIAENAAVGTPVGEPVSATDADEDILFYELLETPDLRDGDDRARFTVDSLSGQLRVGKVLGADAGNAVAGVPKEREDEDSTTLIGGPVLPAGEDAGAAGNGEYVLRVRVSDPSTAAATVNVIVTVTNVNEPPEFDEDAPTLLRARENASVITFGDSDAPLGAGAYAVTDEDGATTGPGAYDDTSYTYSLSGADRTFFTIDNAGTLRFRAGHRPNFENRSSYSTTITARSGEGARGLSSTLDVTVEVENAEDPGWVDLSQRQPEVGIAIHATATDADGGVIVRRWRWDRSDVASACRNYQGDWSAIGGVSSAVYAPRVADFGRCLRATAFYSDNMGDDQRAMGVSEVPVGRHGSADAQEPEGGFVNAAPVFPDQDPITEGDQSDTTSRSVPENTRSGRNIGAPVSAVDDDDDLLIYTLGGADAAFFRITRNTGQLKTRAALNYEFRNTYTVVVTATDPYGAADSIVATIEVTDEDDPPVITVLTAGRSPAGGS